MAVRVISPSLTFVLNEDGIKQALGGTPLLEENAGTKVVTGVKGSAEETYRVGQVEITAANVGLGKVENKTSAEIRAEITQADVEKLLGNSGYTNGTDPKGILAQVQDNASDIADLQSAIGEGSDISDRITALESNKLDKTAFTAQAVEDFIDAANGTKGKVSVRLGKLETAVTDIDDIKEVLGDIDSYDDDDLITRVDAVESGKLNSSAFTAVAVETLLNANYAVDGTVDTRLDAVEDAVKDIDDKLDESEFTTANIEKKLNTNYTGSNGVDARLTSVEATAATVAGKLDKTSFTAEAVEKLLNSEYTGESDGVNDRLEAVEAKAGANENAIKGKLDTTAFTKAAVEALLNPTYSEDGDVDTRLDNLAAKDASQDTEINKKVNETALTASYIEGKLGLDFSEDVDDATSLADKLSKIDEKLADTSSIDSVKEELQEEIDKKLDSSALTGALIIEKLGFTPEKKDDAFKSITASQLKWTGTGVESFYEYEIKASDLSLDSFPTSDTDGEILVKLNDGATWLQWNAWMKAGIVAGSNTADTLTLKAVNKPTADLPIMIGIDLH